MFEKKKKKNPMGKKARRRAEKEKKYRMDAARNKKGVRLPPIGVVGRRVPGLRFLKGGGGGGGKGVGGGGVRCGGGGGGGMGGVGRGNTDCGRAYLSLYLEALFYDQKAVGVILRYERSVHVVAGSRLDL